MGLIRFILIVGMIWLLVVSVQKLRQSWQDRQRRSVTKKQIVQCVYCSVYVPLDEALRNGDDYFCCIDHMQTEKNKT